MKQWKPPSPKAGMSKSSYGWKPRWLVTARDSGGGLIYIAGFATKAEAAKAVKDFNKA